VEGAQRLWLTLLVAQEQQAGLLCSFTEDKKWQIGQLSIEKQK
jgi:hypothetical protein